MSSLQSIMNLDDDRQDASSPMGDKKDKEPATPTSGFRAQDPSTSTPIDHISRTQPSSSSSSTNLSTPTIRLPVLERSNTTYSRHPQPTDTDPRSDSSFQQGKRPAEPTSATPTLSAASSGLGDAHYQSSTSVDSMDQHGYGSASSSSMGAGAGGGGYPPNHPRRPMGSPSPDVQIRLTPITGRVSRAKKGVPVHVCDICNPPKTFTRAEHLRRHQLSHQQPQYGCDKCDRAFHRLDLLTRHQQRHNEEGDNASQGSGASRRASRDSVASGTIEEGMPRLSVRALQPPVGYPSSSQGYGGASTPGSSVSEIPRASSPSASRPGSTMSPPPGGSGDPYGSSTGHQASNDYDGYTLQSGMPMINQPGSMESSPEPPMFSDIDYTPRTTNLPLFVSTEGLTSSALQTALDNPPELVHTTDYSPWTSASESTYSTPSDMSSRRRYIRHAQENSFDWQTNPNLLSAFAAGTRREISTGGSLEAMAAPYYVTTGLPFSPQLAPHIAAPHSTPYDTLISEPMLSSGFADEQSLLDPAIASSSVRSPPPPASASMSGRVADTMVTPASLRPRINPMAHARHKELAMGAMDSDGSNSQWNGDGASDSGIVIGGPELTGPGGCGIGGVFTPLSRSIRNAIPAYVDVYWQRFHTLYPVVHRPSFETAGEEILRCAMAAIATQFLDSKEDRIRGTQLHEYAWQEAKRSSPRSLQVMQAILLCEHFSRFRGRKAVVRPSKLFESLYSRVLDHNPGFYEPALPSGAAGFGSHQNMGMHSGGGIEQQWRAWVEAEGRRRLSTACFIVDTHASIFHQQPPARDDIDASTLPLTAYSDALWEATSAHQWAAILKTDPAAGRPQTLPRLDALSPDEVAQYTAFDQALILNAAALSLPRHHNPRSTTVQGDDQVVPDDLRTPTNASYAQSVRADERLAHLFSHCTTGSDADVYVALSHTPLDDLLAVSGDSWVFSQKVLGKPSFLEHQKRLRAWAEGRGSAVSPTQQLQQQSSPISPTTAGLAGMSATRATIHAARALVGYLEHGIDGACLSDFWGMYVCALIIWAFGHRAGGKSHSFSSSSGGGASGSPTTTTKGSASTRMGEAEIIAWLRTVAQQGQPEHVTRVRGRREAGAAVVSLARRRLEAGLLSGRSLLFMDAVSVLKALEQGANVRRF